MFRREIVLPTPGEFEIMCSLKNKKRLREIMRYVNRNLRKGKARMDNPGIYLCDVELSNMFADKLAEFGWQFERRLTHGGDLIVLSPLS